MDGNTVSKSLNENPIVKIRPLMDGNYFFLDIQYILSYVKIRPLMDGNSIIP